MSEYLCQFSQQDSVETLHLKAWLNLAFELWYQSFLCLTDFREAQLSMLQDSSEGHLCL